MRLLNVSSFKLEQFYSDIPRYAILSHTWGKDEVTFDEFPILARTSRRLSKADRCCRTTKWFGLNYVWIDTFCINKDSSAELSESINSMYRWYQDAVICLAYLSDVEGDDVGEGSSFRKSRWFTRGWTLQELVAPQNMVFLDSEWEIIGWRGTGWYDDEWGMNDGATHLMEWMEVQDAPLPRGISTAVCQVTGIGAQYLQTWYRGNINVATVAEKMSWAAKRETTRPEDMAYSLLGIFSISMPLLYGEGGERAFVRLQEEVTRQSHDLTMFAWGFGLGPTRCSIFASSPADFAGCGELTQSDSRLWPRRSHYTVTNLGVQTNARYVPVGTRVCYMLLDTVWREDDALMAVPMTRSEHQDDILGRSAGSIPLFVPDNWLAKAQSQQVYLAGDPFPKISGYTYSISLCRVLRHRGYRIIEIYPPHAAYGPTKDGGCEITDREEVIIVRLANDGPDHFYAGIYKSGGRWRCRMLGCNPHATVAELLWGVVGNTEPAIKDLVDRWSPAIPLRDSDVAARVAQGSREIPYPDGETGTELVMKVTLYVSGP